MRFYSALVGLSLEAMSMLLLFWDGVPPELQLSTSHSLLMAGIGLALMIFGRHYLLHWIGYSLSGSNDTD
ncbi:hypothetical protein NBRC116494_01150 [Aurantivibrio plasticivorans]